MIYQYPSIDYNEMHICVERIISLLSQINIVTLSGELGSGKTTLTAMTLHKLGIVDVIQSPTFTYVTHYKNINGNSIYHFDLYRITKLSDFYEMGFDEYLYQKNSISFIEWPEIIKPILPKSLCAVTIHHLNNLKRSIEINLHN